MSTGSRSTPLSLHVALATIALVPFGRLAAQTPAERAALARWSDSLAHATTSAAIATVAMRARSAPGAVGDLRLAEWQLHQVTLRQDNDQLQRTLTRLDGVAVAHRDWPIPEVLMSQAFFALSDSGAPMKLSAGLHEGELYEEAAWRHLRAALAIDPHCEPARALALAILVPEGDRQLRGDELKTLRSLRRTVRPEPDLLLVLGRNYRDHRAYDSALVMFDSALAMRGDRAVIQLDRAHVLSALGDTAAAATAYWDGLDHVTPAGREAYRYDLAWILAPDSLNAYDAVPNDSLAGWMARFWARRDAEAANYPGQRLQEQFRRWTYAFEHYRVAIPWRHTQFTRVELGFEGFDDCVSSDAELYELLAREQPSHLGDVRRREPLLDHRGLIYLHHGEPYRRVYGPGNFFESDTTVATQLALPSSGLDLGKSPAADTLLMGYCIKNIKDTENGWAIGPNESWLYWIDGAWRVVNFRGSCALGRYAATTITSYLPVSSKTVGDWLARSNLTPEYHDAAMQIFGYTGSQPLTCLPQVTAVIDSSRVNADIATRTDSHTPYIGVPWNAVVQAFALGSGTDGTGEALVTFAVPLKALTIGYTADSTPIYALSARLTGFDRLSGRTFAVDTLRRINVPSGPHRPDTYLAGYFELALPAGDWELGVRMNQGVDSIGTYALAPHLRVGGGDSLSMSDIITGVAGGVDWPAPDGSSFAVNARAAWMVGSNADVYFEVRGLQANTEYQTIIEVRGAGDKDLVRLESTDRATGATTTVRKVLGLSQLAPGDYRLLVTAVAGAHQVVREQRVLVVKAK